MGLRTKRQRRGKRMAAFFMAALALSSMLIVMISYTSYMVLKVLQTRETLSTALPGGSTDSPISTTRSIGRVS